MYYKHYNIFEPNHPSIVDLINKRAEWDILQKSLDKCHVICSSCENIVDSLLLHLDYDQEKHKLYETLPTPSSSSDKCKARRALHTYSYSAFATQMAEYSEFFVSASSNACATLPLLETPPEDNTEQWILYRDDFNEKMEEIIQSLSGLYENTASL